MYGLHSRNRKYLEQHNNQNFFASLLQSKLFAGEKMRRCPENIAFNWLSSRVRLTQVPSQLHIIISLKITTENTAGRYVEK